MTTMFRNWSILYNQYPVKRKAHYLSKLRSNDFPTQVIFVDTETSQSNIDDLTLEHKLRLGYAIYARDRGDGVLRKEDECIFYDKETFWKWLNSKVTSKKKIYFTSHNLQFDLSILDAFIILPEYGWRLTGCYSKGLVNIFKWNGLNSKLLMIDNQNFFSTSLEQLGKQIKLQKLKVDFMGEQSQLLTYCIRDTEIIYSAWLELIAFIKKHKLGSFKQTISSIAMSSFRTRFMKHSIHCHNNKQAIVLERLSYFGGRTQNFIKQEIYNKKFYLYDVNSMYPFVMRENEYPTYLYEVLENVSIKNLSRILKNRCVIADVTIKTNEAWFPYAHKDHTIYPVGEFRTVLTTNELKLCVERNWILQVHYAAIYDKAPIFVEYVDYFYNLRQKYKDKGYDAWNYLCKLLGNGLYGKYGQLDIKQTVRENDTDEIVGHTTHTFDDATKNYDEFILGGSIFDIRREGEAYNAFTAISAHVTANARLYLCAVISTAGKGHVYYCDTDSVILDRSGAINCHVLVDKVTIGKIKLETRSNWLKIYAPKHYSLDGKNKIKGVRKDAVQICSICGQHNEKEYRICKECKQPIKEKEFIQLRWDRLATQIRRKNVSQYTMRYHLKVLSQKIHHGYLHHSGQVLSFRLCQWGKDYFRPCFELQPFPYLTFSMLLLTYGIVLTHSSFCYAPFHFSKIDIDRLFTK